MHLLDNLLHDLDGAGRTSHDTCTQSAQMESSKLRVLQFRDEHGRNTVERRASFLFDRTERMARRIKRCRRNHHGGARQNRREVAQHHAEAVIERNRNADAILDRTGSCCCR